MRYDTLHWDGLYRVRYNSYCPSAAHAAEMTCVILTEIWLQRVRAVSTGREMEDWVKNNRDIIDAFECSESVGNPDFRVFERLQYPCEHCSKVTPLREAYLVAVDADGLPDHEGFPKYLCKKCKIEAIGDDV